MYDLIGDIHGYAGPLRRLLTKLGYTDDGICWKHPHRKVIFLGDFVDRGPEQLASVMIAKNMVENGAALAVMGNHEFNAIAYATPHPSMPGEYLRAHIAKNTKQHIAFLSAVEEGSEQHQEIIDWFKSLPLYLELEGLRVIHACWDRKSLEILQPFLEDDNSLKGSAWLDVTTKGTEAFEAAETLLKGLEIPLPAGIDFHDKDGTPRSNIRTRWWETQQLTYRDLAIVPDDIIEQLPHDPIEQDLLPGYDGDKPLFLGHYWLTGRPQPRTDHIAILDYSIAAEHASSSGSTGKLCAYRWEGESILTEDNFVWVEGNV